MKKVYYLSSCNTCQRIIASLPLDDGFVHQDIKTDKITGTQLDALARLAGGYEPLFSRVARKYRSQGLHEKELNEQDYRSLILEEYTFLKRPVFVINEQIFIGNSKKTVDELAAVLRASY